MRRILFVFVLCGRLISSEGAYAAEGMNAVAERYAHLVLDCAEKSLAAT